LCIEWVGDRERKEAERGRKERRGRKGREGEGEKSTTLFDIFVYNPCGMNCTKSFCCLKKIKLIYNTASLFQMM
jgi:hypothetical protein